MLCACLNCGYVYAPKKGDPSQGIAPGTEACDLPKDWTCPKCKGSQDDFAMMEEEED